MINSTENSRLYYLDWLRVIAFGLLVFYHTGLMFVDWGFHIQNNEFSESLKFPMLFLNQWRLPLLFLVSGAGVRFALGRKSKREFAKERFTRLFIPLVFGMAFIIPPQLYYEQLNNHSIDVSYFEYFPTYFRLETVTWKHLWFVIYLFTFTFLSLPLFMYLRSSKGTELMAKFISFFTKGKGRILILVLPLFITELFLRNSWPDNRNLVTDWYNFTFYIIIFIYGFIIASGKSLWPLFEKERFIYLACGIISFLMIFLGWHQPEINFLETSEAGVLIFSFFKCLNIISWILSGLGFARHYLNFGNEFLSYANRAVFPFFILHQTVLTIVGYYIIQYNWSIAVKYSLIVIGTFFFTILIYELLIRRIKPSWILFGLK